MLTSIRPIYLDETGVVNAKGLEEWRKGRREPILLVPDLRLKLTQILIILQQIYKGYH